MWYFNIGDCLIEVTAWTGLTEYICMPIIITSCTMQIPVIRVFFFIVCLFGDCWIDGIDNKVNVPYIYRSNAEISGQVGLNIGLQKINITLKGNNLIVCIIYLYINVRKVVFLNKLHLNVTSYMLYLFSYLQIENLN
jgi:hypothetical protein